jgi:hypothetical protein
LDGVAKNDTSISSSSASDLIQVGAPILSALQNQRKDEVNCVHKPTKAEVNDCSATNDGDDFGNVHGGVPVFVILDTRGKLN